MTKYLPKRQASPKRCVGTKQTDKFSEPASVLAHKATNFHDLRQEKPGLLGMSAKGRESVTDWEDGMRV